MVKYTNSLDNIYYKTVSEAYNAAVNKLKVDDEILLAMRDENDNIIASIEIIIDIFDRGWAARNIDTIPMNRWLDLITFENMKIFDKYSSEIREELVKHEESFSIENTLVKLNDSQYEINVLHDEIANIFKEMVCSLDDLVNALSLDGVDVYDFANVSPNISILNISMKFINDKLNSMCRLYNSSVESYKYIKSYYNSEYASKKLVETTDGLLYHIKNIFALSQNYQSTLVHIVSMFNDINICINGILRVNNRCNSIKSLLKYTEYIWLSDKDSTYMGIAGHHVNDISKTNKLITQQKEMVLQHMKNYHKFNNILTYEKKLKKIYYNFINIHLDSLKQVDNFVKDAERIFNKRNMDNHSIQLWNLKRLV